MCVLVGYWQVLGPGEVWLSIVMAARGIRSRDLAGITKEYDLASGDSIDHHLWQATVGCGPVTICLRPALFLSGFATCHFAYIKHWNKCSLYCSPDHCKEMWWKITASQWIEAVAWQATRGTGWNCRFGRCHPQGPFKQGHHIRGDRAAKTGNIKIIFVNRLDLELQRAIWGNGHSRTGWSGSIDW